MKYHIVQVNETIKDIARKYQVNVSEIVKLNRHINNLDYIVPGMKIRLPVLTEEVSEELKDDFLDIEKYYPKVEDFKDILTEKKEEPKTEEVNQTQHENYQMPYYPNYQYYPYQIYNPYYYQQPYYPRVTPLNSISTEDLTLPQYRIKGDNIQGNFDIPAICNPNFIQSNHHSRNIQTSQSFQTTLYKPPYPINIDFQNVSQPIRVDLREFVKKNTYTKKKPKV